MKGFIKKVFSGVGKKAEGKNRASSGVPVFDMDFYTDITEARLKHLESLKLPVAGRSVVDTGCGIGRLSEFFVSQGCDILCVDGRQENIEKLRELYPGRKAAVADLETTQMLDYGQFDIVFSYGLLYHLNDPFGFIKNTFRICKEMIILETCITDAEDPILRLVPEPNENASQAVYGVGSRPSSSYVVTCLKLAGFKYVYKPVNLPKHPQFQYKRINDFSHIRNGAPIRDIFIASHAKLENNNLKLCK